VKKAVNDWLSDGDYVLEVHPFPANLAAGAKMDRSKTPALGKPEKLTLPPMQRATLSNGLRVVMVERHNAPVVDFSLMVKGGYAADSPELPGVVTFAQRMLEEGTPARNSLRIGEELEAIGAKFTTSASLDWTTASLNVLKATMPQGLEIFSDLVLHPAYPKSDFERLRRDRIAAIARDKVTPERMALRVVPSLLYGKTHPYATAFSGMGTEAALTRMTREDLAKFHQAAFKPNNSILLVVGDTTLAEITPKLEALFAGWKAGPVPAKTLPPAAAPEKSAVYLIDRPGALQSVIVGAQLAPPRNDPDAVALQLVNNIFGGSFSSRINMNLREDKHWSYGVRTLLPDALGPRPYLSLSPVQTDKTKEALHELVAEYAGIAGAKPIAAKELEEFQAQDTLKLPGSFETAGQLAAAYGTILQYDLPEDYYNTFTQKTLALTPDQANALAKRTVQPGRVIWVVVGDMSKVERGVRELNLGDVRRIDADGNPAS
jgi:zinc protease